MANGRMSGTNLKVRQPCNAWFQTNCRQPMLLEKLVGRWRMKDESEGGVWERQRPWLNLVGVLQL